MQRQLKKEVKIGNIKIGGTNPIAVQTMLNVPVKDIAGNVAQALLEEWPEITSIDLRIIKRNPPMGADCDGAGVEIHLINDKNRLQ